MTDQLAQLIQDVADESTLVDGLSTLIDGLVAAETALAAQLKSAGTNPAKLADIHAALVANATKLGAKKQAIADALSANSPSSSSAITVSPTSGIVGSQATITGTGFGTVQGASTLTCGGHPATINSWSDTSISFSVPTGADQTGIVLTVGNNVLKSAFTVN